MSRHSVKNKAQLALLLISASLLPNMAMAQQRPDAGKTLQELRPAPSLPAPSSNVSVEVPRSQAAQPGGKQVAIQSIVIDGNTLFSDDELLNLLHGAAGNSLDLAQMKSLADVITAYYRAHDYPFTRALIPAQTMKDGVLKINVVEGRYGEVNVTPDGPRVETMQDFLKDLKRGDVISGQPLERATLILDDQPGYDVMPVVRPGAQLGEGDLDVRMTRSSRFGGAVGVDNYGNRYTGRLRATADFHADSPFMFGDQITLSTIYTQEDMWHGALGYSLPIGSSGLRGNIGYTHTYYELGKEFNSLDAHGTAKIASVGLSYPLIRSQKANLTLATNYQHKWLVDTQGSTNTSNSKNSDSLLIAASFDRRDTLLGGGITYGVISWTPGTLDLDNSLQATDSTTAKSSGYFNKVNLDAARLQALPLGFTFFARASGQWAANNLDSSEKFGLGGSNGVRAYPTGESYGDIGGLGQLELRYAIQDFTPYAFYDGGWIKTNADTWAAGKNTRTIGGPGLGLRFNINGWHADGTVAWRTNGGDPKSDSKHDTPQIFVKAGYRF